MVTSAYAATTTFGITLRYISENIDYSQSDSIIDSDYYNFYTRIYTADANGNSTATTWFEYTYAFSSMGADLKSKLAGSAIDEKFNLTHDFKPGTYVLCTQLWLQNTPVTDTKLNDWTLMELPFTIDESGVMRDLNGNDLNSKLDLTAIHSNGTGNASSKVCITPIPTDPNAKNNDDYYSKNYMPGFIPSYNVYDNSNAPIYIPTYPSDSENNAEEIAFAPIATPTPEIPADESLNYEEEVSSYGGNSSENEEYVDSSLAEEDTESDKDVEEEEHIEEDKGNPTTGDENSWFILIVLAQLIAVTCLYAMFKGRKKRVRQN
jgi:hypothetical protein